MNYKFGNNPFELPTNTDLEAVLKKNLDHINPVEMKEKTINGKKTYFPFWTPVNDAAGNTFTDPKEYLATKDKKLNIKPKKDQVGIVQPKDAITSNTKTYEDSSFQDKILSIINHHNDSAVYDNSGAVKAISFAMGHTSSSKQVTDNDTTDPKDATVDKSSKSKTGVGAVDPKSAGLDKTKTAKQIIDHDTTNPKDATVDKSTKSKTGVGAVDPKSAGLDKTKTSTQITNNDTTSPKKATVDKSTKSKTGVGAVTPKADMGKQNGVGPINFDKFKTDHIKGA